MDTMHLNHKLDSFPVSIVEATTTHYNKTFHSKIITLFASSESEISTFSQMHKSHYDFCFGFMKNDEGQWYLDIESISKVRKWVIEQCKVDSNNIFNMYDDWKKDWQIYLGLTKKIRALDELSDLQLYSKFKELYNQYLRVGSVAYIADSFMSTGTEDWLEKILSDELESKGIADKNIGTIRKLTSPVHFSFTLEAEYQLLKIAYSIIKKYSKKLPEYSEIKDISDLKKMEERFHWIQNNYYNVHFISAGEFYKQVKKIILEAGTKESLKKSIDEKESHLNQIKKERSSLMGSLELSKFAKNLLEVAGLFAKWKDVRKSGVYIGMYYFDIFLNEISKRTNIPKTDLNYLIFDEIENVY